MLKAGDDQAITINTAVPVDLQHTHITYLYLFTFTRCDIHL